MGFSPRQLAFHRFRIQGSIDCHTMTFPDKQRHSQCVMCTEQDCESLVYMSDQNKSMIETLGIHEDPFWQERVRSSMDGFINRQGLPRLHGHGRKVKITPNGQLLETLPSDINPFQSSRQIVQFQRRSHFHGEILEILTPTLTSSIRTIQLKNAQSRRSSILRLSSSSRT